MLMTCCIKYQLLAQFHADVSLGSVPPATEDEISALPIVKITRAVLGMSTVTRGTASAMKVKRN